MHDFHGKFPSNYTGGKIAILVVKPIGSISSGVEASSPPQLARISATAQNLISFIPIPYVKSLNDKDILFTAS
jgi:hypothetical protein